MGRRGEQQDQLASASSIRGLATALIVVALPLSLRAEHLRPETSQAFDQYVQQVKARLHARTRPGATFLWIDESPERKEAVRHGEILVTPIGERCPKPVANGLIHDWIADIFLPDTTLTDVMSVVRDYDQYPKFYKPYVIEAKPLSKDAQEDRFSMMLLNKSIFQRTALDNDYQTNYVWLSPTRIYSVSHTTRVQEIDNLGQSSQREMPVDTGNGYVWRLYSISKMEEGEGGVYLELEAVLLSRDIPAAFHWFVDPIVRRVSKDAMITTLQQTSAAVHSRVVAAKQEKSACETASTADCLHARKSRPESEATSQRPR